MCKTSKRLTPLANMALEIYDKFCKEGIFTKVFLSIKGCLRRCLSFYSEIGLNISSFQLLIFFLIYYYD